MDTLTSAAATARLGLPNVQAFLRLATKKQINPVLKGPGPRGPFFWNSADIERLATDDEAVA